MEKQDALVADVRKYSIREWNEEDRPREKLVAKGRHVLTNAELLGILLGSGNRDENAVELARRILATADNSLNELAKFGIKELTKFKGMGQAKAVNIISALELGRRRKEEKTQKKPTITCSADVHNTVRPYLMDLPHEEFWVLLLNRANMVMKVEKISQGGVAGTVADPKLIFSKAVEILASAVILVHNHPSGNKKPSDADIRLTKKMVEGGRVLDTPVLDHLIYTDAGYFSFADEGLL